MTPYRVARGHSNARCGANLRSLLRTGLSRFARPTPQIWTSIPQPGEPPRRNTRCGANLRFLLRKPIRVRRRGPPRAGARASPSTSPDPLDPVGHGVGLARAGDAEQHLVALAGEELRHQRRDRLRLVARRLVLGNQPERARADDQRRRPVDGARMPRRPVRARGLGVCGGRVRRDGRPPFRNLCRHAFYISVRWGRGPERTKTELRSLRPPPRCRAARIGRNSDF